MSDEESFVILGTSSMASIRSEREQDSLGSKYSSLTISQVQPKSTVNTSLDSSTIDKSINKAANGKPQSIKGESTSGAVLAGSQPNLAASFIMGEIDASVLKTSVYSQFPSMCSMEACADDVVKLQNLMTEYIELKNTLAKVNITMKQFYDRTQQWRDDMQTMEKNYKEQLQNCQVQIATLRNENLQLKRDLESKVDQMKLTEDMRQKEHNELVRELSEKSSQITNMSVQIERLELQQLTSFEYVPKHENDTKEKPDYVDRLEHQRILKRFEWQISELLAENLDLKDVQKQYVDEINCLKVNLIAAEELLKQSRADINVLKAKDIEKSEIFSRYENDRDSMRDEMVLLRQQIDIYSKDFEMERAARQTLAGEKDQLLQDLRGLQRKNHSLIEETQKQFENMERSRKSASPPAPIVTAAVVVPLEVPAETITAKATASTPTSASTSIASGADSTENISLCCPVCTKEFSAYTVLTSHVNDCLDKNCN